MSNKGLRCTMMLMISVEALTGSTVSATQSWSNSLKPTRPHEDVFLRAGNVGTKRSLSMAAEKAKIAKEKAESRALNELKKVGKELKTPEETLRFKCMIEKVVENSEGTKSTEVNASALKEAIEKTCKMGEAIMVDDIRNVVQQSGEAGAFAQASAAARISCKSYDKNAYECFEVTASASAYAEATAEAHAKAVASAIQDCGCGSKAEAQSQLSSDLYIKLVAEAAVTATAQVCLKGEGRVSNTAWEQCTSLVYGELIATAVAEAMVAGDCLDPSATILTEGNSTLTTTAESTCGMTAKAIQLPPL